MDNLSCPDPSELYLGLSGFFQGSGIFNPNNSTKDCVIIITMKHQKSNSL